MSVFLLKNNLKSIPVKILLAISFLIYSNTLFFEYVLDDKIVITNNQITKEGLSGMHKHFFYDSMDGFWANSYKIKVEKLGQKRLVSGGRYRPLTMITHSIEYGIFGKMPFFSHLINVLLFSLTCMFLFIFLKQLFPYESKKWYLSFPFLSTLIFVCHPIHTEVVANIKGRDEILSFLFVIIAAIPFIQSFNNNKNKKQKIWLSALFLFLSLLSKESSISFLIIIPAIVYFFKKNVCLKKIIFQSIPLFLVAIIYLVIRFYVIGISQNIPKELLNNPFILATSTEKLATIILTLGVYFKLLFFPHPLTHDYYPFYVPSFTESQQYANMSDNYVIITIIILLFLLSIMIYGIKKRTIWSFLIMWYLSSLFLLSNILFPVGTFMNERFLYIPSVAFSIGIVYFIKYIISKKNYFIVIIVSIFCVCLSAKTFYRNFAWKNDGTLALADVKTSKKSTKSNMSAGLQFMEKAEKTRNNKEKKELYIKAIKHLKTSIKIYKKYPQPLILLGKSYYKIEKYELSIKYLLKLAKINRNFENQAAGNIIIINTRELLKQKKINKAIETLNILEKIYPKMHEIYMVLGEAYGRYLGDFENSKKYLERALIIEPNNAEVLQNLGSLYAQSGKLKEAIKYFEKSFKKNPTNKNLVQNLIIAYRESKNQKKVSKYNQILQILNNN